MEVFCNTGEKVCAADGACNTDKKTCDDGKTVMLMARSAMIMGRLAMLTGSSK